MAELVRVTQSQPCCSSSWEEAYLRFETPEEEIAKFMRRLLALGAAGWPKDWRVVELFSGRGNGLHALSQLGFRHVEGVDLSETLIRQYNGDAKCYIGDCRALPFENESQDLIVVQGGLHHLPDIPRDLTLTLREITRVLRPSGFAVLIEPWNTRFLRVVHLICRFQLMRRLSRKIDSLRTMIENEKDTYEKWLSHPNAILTALEKNFYKTIVTKRWGKMTCIGYAAPEAFREAKQRCQ